MRFCRGPWEVSTNSNPQTQLSCGADRFVEKSPSRLLITLHSEQEIDSLALLVDGAIEIFPLTSDFDIRFIQPPAIASPFLVFTKSFLDARTGGDPLLVRAPESVGQCYWTSDLRTIALLMPSKPRSNDLPMNNFIRGLNQPRNSK